MAPPESFEVQYSLLSKILAEEAPPTKNWKKKFVLKWVLGNLKGFKLIIYFFKNVNKSSAQNPPGIGLFDEIITDQLH